jgi:hypothetical protein
MLVANLTNRNVDNDTDMFVAPLTPQGKGGTGVKVPSNLNIYSSDSPQGWGVRGGRHRFRGLSAVSIYYEIFRQQHLSKGGLGGLEGWGDYAVLE